MWGPTQLIHPFPDHRLEGESGKRNIFPLSEFPPPPRTGVGKGHSDLYFGPKAPEGKESNWAQSNPGESFIVYLRLYEPLKPYAEQIWPVYMIQKNK